MAIQFRRLLALANEVQSLGREQILLIIKMPDLRAPMHYIMIRQPGISASIQGDILAAHFPG